MSEREVPELPVTILEAWERLIAGLPHAASEHERERLRRVFYAGATVMWHLAIMRVRCIADEAVALAELERLEGELARYAAQAATSVLVDHAIGARRAH